ncbi:TetR/AcrR family transcriptional regulator [Vibrio sp. SM6]|uniref:TetR/AcrR family transcriptional regulator n=1 Tax=Vibrio agarilyticus TaxID=2726741 RepID=A0A7X8YIF9_9VIBR|nr:TetR/AcrR family transcriptional regulator [Vibrio agarilyticus]NLS14575.1 TetR/AcrR family transcriptional regulator [Vibrio agarilyticus]
MKNVIASRLEMAFSQYGFAEPSVNQLKDACEVSLRTLYKYYPSKEAMIVAALEYRHQRYVNLLLQDAPLPGYPAIIDIITKLAWWMEEFAPHGCLYSNALAAFPSDKTISERVEQHKWQVKRFVISQSGNPMLGDAIFLVLEGMSSTWPIYGSAAVESAKQAIALLYRNNELI